mmetsp:Transcript_5498/g.11975  ORF Transcript_5498/g.11975 Transcript_5498/m.11975 type:complete len:733 (+) Transcript_5498:145-2343(+)|eukprot:CAMPEP_0172527072 /NCGR_PEP_ID=MMETSP1067-20121228/1846_1 /TAXON_ID=265564 ORGANISM="Thalassiosira punctigera, Strain Tpunct2005C2" /NCGR_SAMPLE_ID=MMETSP1067 /ASSEMBLY_ACC=CAM_ASM_000444 /LENGTH=732 /DNA_ID=CAMNT_0013310737 /DNA_START=127 /DNA_END=2325 /DNA_ORIENTATION=-
MPINPRRQTLAPSKPRAAPASKPGGAGGGGNGGVNGGGATGGAGRRVPKSRKSMIPRCAGSPAPAPDGGGGGGGGDGGNDNVNRENNGRVSGIAAPSPSRHGRSRPAASRKSLGGAILQRGGGGGHPNPPSKTPTKNRRVSVAPSAAAAASSGAAHGGVSSNVDPRDVKDKSYLQGAVKKMVSYLKSRGYRDASALSVRQLVNGPSGRDFQNIMTFLFRRFDPTFHMPPAPGRQQRSDEVALKFEDEVSMAFRCLGYPFPVSKTGLVAVGSPHTWPALIAAIDWLIDVLVICDGEEIAEWAPDEDDRSAEEEEEEILTLAGSSGRVERQFHKFLRKSFVAFLDDDNEECEELEGALLDELQRDSERVEAYLTGCDDECGRMSEEIELLNREVDGLSDAQQKQEEYATNIEKFLNLIESLNEHKAELTNKVDTLTNQESTTQNEINECTKKIEQLRKTIDGQELSQEDVRRMERERSRIEEQVARQNAVLEGEAAALKEAEEKWLAMYRLLERNVAEYNAAARRVGLIPEGAKHAGGNNFEVKLIKDRANEGVVSMMGGVDISGVVIPHLKKLVTGYENEIANEKKRILGMKQRIEVTEKSIEQLIEEIEAIKDKIASFEEESAATKGRLEADIEDKRRRLDLLNTKISSLDDPDGVAAAMERLEAEYKQLQLRQRREEKEHVANKRAVADEIRRALELAKEYEEEKRKRLSEMNAYIEKRREECARIQLLDS